MHNILHDIVVSTHLRKDSLNGCSLPVEHGSVTFNAAAVATAASAALPPCCKILIPACTKKQHMTILIADDGLEPPGVHVP